MPMSSGGVMPNNGDGYAVDTSVSVAALDAGHAAHAACRAVVVRHRPALAGHAAFETYSVLTRMPGQVVVDPPTATDVIRRLFPDACWLEGDAASTLLERCGVVGISGGAVYDALVAEAARVNHRRLLTRDQRARRTYDLIGVDYELVG